jgi:phosphoesterase RecJ-like protein
MALTLTQQIFELIKRSHNILITFPKEWSGDALASSLALSLIFKKLGKKTDIVCDQFTPPPKYSFLPHIEKIKPTIQNLRKLIVSFDIDKNKIHELNYNITDNKLNIFISSEKEINHDKITTSLSPFKYDLIFTLDATDLESLNQVYFQNIEFFYHTPIINIDHKAENENFGQINLIDLKAAAIAEIIFNLIEAGKINLIDETIATHLLTGIILKTKSFELPTVTPRTLYIAGQLISQGAKREEIIKNLYQTRTLKTLNLWGKALMRLRYDQNYKLVWTTLIREDFITVGVSSHELLDVVDELIFNSPEAKIVVLIYESPEENNKICCFIFSKDINVLSFKQLFNAEGSKNLIEFCLLNENIIEAEKKIINTLKENLK